MTPRYVTVKKAAEMLGYTVCAINKKIERNVWAQDEVWIKAPALQALQAQKQYTFLKGEEVFQDPRYRERWAGDQAIRQRFWKPTLEAAGVRYRRPYQTRHTYASMMLSAGEPLAWVASQMGHTDTNMIARVYGRWIPDAAPDAGGKAEKAFNR